MDQLLTIDEIKYLFAAFIAAAFLGLTGCGITSEGLTTTGYLRELNRKREIELRFAELGNPLESHSEKDKRELAAILGR